MIIIKVTEEIKQYFSKCNKLLWILTLSTTIFSLLLISSMQRAGSYNFFKTQLLAVIIGLIGSIVISLINYKFIIKYWWAFAIGGIALAVLVFVSGIQVTGTDDIGWIRLPGGITFQPSEFIKLCFIITFAKHLSFLQDKNLIRSLFGVISLVIHLVIPVLILHIQGDDGAVLIFAIIALMMMFLAGVEWKYFAVLFGTIAVSLPFIWMFFMNNEHRNRFKALFDLEGNALTNYGWQQYQGKVSIASGQLNGSGLFKGTRTGYGIVPEQENDFIFTVAGEETGFIGCLILLIILFAISIIVLISGKKSYNNKGELLCYGIFALISSQVIINIGMVLGLVPVIGITLPFFSAGGTAVISMYIAVGLVQNVIIHNEDDTESARIRIGSQSRIKL